MKKQIFLLVTSSVIALNSFAGGGGCTGTEIPCSTANPFCTGITYDFPNETNTCAPEDLSYGCLSSQPNPVWYYMEVDQSGTFQIDISQTSGPNGTGSGLDVDFALYGPFSSLSSGCASVDGGASPIQCSYNTAATETVGLGIFGGDAGAGGSTPPASVAGQVYILLITNYDGDSGYITFSQTGGTGVSDCSIVTPCNISALSANPSACYPATNLCDLSGAVTFVTPPATGTLTVASSCGGTQTFNAPFTSPLAYSLLGLPSNGAACTVTAAFSDDATCTFTSPFTAPSSCAMVCAVTDLTAVPSGCLTNNTYNVSGSVSFANQPVTGTLTVSNGCGGSQVFNAPFVSPINYSINGLNADGVACTITASFSATSCSLTQNYTAPALPTVFGGLDHVVCSGEQVTLSGSGASTYAWNNGIMNSLAFIPSSTTTYTVTGTDANGCTNTDQVDVTVNPLPPVNAGTDHAVCTGFQTTLSASGATSYVWDNSITDGVAFTPLSTLTYSVTGTDANGCVNSDQIVVTVNPLPTVNAGLDQTVCIGDLVSLSATGASSYLWNNGVVNGMSFNPVNTATYTVTGTDANGCVNTDQVTVTVTSVSTPSAGADQIICLGNQAVLTVNYASGILWSTGETTQSITVSPTINTNYTVTVTNGPCFGTDDVLVSVQTAPVVDAGQDITICTGDHAVLTASGSGAFTWSHGLGNSPQVNVNPSATTTYTVSLSNSIGCTSTDDITVSIYPIQNITFTPSTVHICHGQSAVITASGADSYTWFPNYGLSSTQGSSVVATPLVSTNYAIIGTYGPGCENNSTIQVDVDKVEAAFQIPDYACQSDTVILSPSVTAGVSPYTYVWQNTGYTGSSFQVIAQETTSYSVIVTDALGCTKTANVTLYVHDSLKIDAYSNFNTVCKGDTVLMNAAIWGGTGVPYTLRIDNVYSTTIQTFVIDQNHDYIFIAEDGCMQATDTVKMKLYPVPFVDFIVDKNVACEDETIKFTSTIQPLSLVSDYSWNFGDGDAHNLSLHSNPDHAYNRASLYDVSLDVLTTDGCLIETTKHGYIRINANPIAQFKPTPPVASIIKPEIYFENMSIGASSYYWNFYTGDESNLMNPIYSYQNIGNYEVMLIAYSEFGCPDTAYGNIKIEPVIEIWFPTAFSPDGDNLNDYFGPKGINILEKDFEMTIYDRWGEPIFTTNDLYLGWDGRAKNNEYVQVGVYKYIAKFKDAYDITHEASGSVNVIR